MYLWLKAFHVVAVISWMAGLLYLPRLMVYHSVVDVGSDSDATFRVMERRLLNAIMTPAGIVAVLSGLALVHLGGWSFGDVWLAVKLFCVAGLVASHWVLRTHVLAFAKGVRLRPQAFYRIINEVPTMLMIIIVICVVVKPFS